MIPSLSLTLAFMNSWPHLSFSVNLVFQLNAQGLLADSWAHLSFSVFCLHPAFLMISCLAFAILCSSSGSLPYTPASPRLAPSCPVPLSWAIPCRADQSVYSCVFLCMCFASLSEPEAVMGLIMHSRISFLANAFSTHWYFVSDLPPVNVRDRLMTQK